MSKDSLPKFFKEFLNVEWSTQIVWPIIRDNLWWPSSGDKGRLPEAIKNVKAGLSQKMMPLPRPQRDGRSHVKDAI